MRVFKALEEGHPLINGALCWICGEDFKTGERIMLLQYETVEMAESQTVQTRPAHATCRLRGSQTVAGIIDRIKDGDGSPFPVVTTDGKQWKLEEVGLTD